MGAPRKRLRQEETALVELDDAQLVEGLRHTRHDFCDVSVRGADDPSRPVQWIACHRIVLMACSGWFRCMLRSPMQESTQNHIQLKSIPHDILGQLINSMYSRELSVDGSNALFLWQAADMLELSQIVEACKDFLRQSVDKTNWLTIQRGAKLLHCADLIQQCQAFALEYFTTVCHSGEFLEMDAAELSELIGADELNVEDEEQVADAVLRWLDHSPDRASEVVRQPVVFTMSHDSEAEEYEGRLDCIDPYTGRYVSFPCADPPTYCKHPAAFVLENDRLTVYFAVLYGWSGNPPVVHKYDALLDRWIALGNGDFPITELIIVVIHDQVYAVGEQTLHCYDAIENQWVAKAIVHVRRGSARQ
ncbi:kelch-like protein 3 [Paramacrobiotus metropolitanus]|uniref:kelch-like protein 3 n=1 Tax=Paramacrobiotus metropolitanus TaxID=2943436 RepID=UPI002445996C|nr:kelch-like protein 3 [Paramacrobiotus metropolitanus]